MNQTHAVNDSRYCLFAIADEEALLWAPVLYFSFCSLTHRLGRRRLYLISEGAQCLGPAPNLFR